MCRSKEEAMATARITRYRALGDTVLERMGNQAVPPMMKGALKSFQAMHRQYLVAADAADAARAVRDTALQAVADDDAALDASLDTLAEKLVGAGLGSRTRPLASFSRYSVSGLAALAYKKEAGEVVAMGAKIAKAKPPKQVAAAAAVCVKNANKVLDGLTALVRLQAAYDKALRARDRLLPDWTKAFAKLKKLAAAAWVDDEATFKSVFARVEGIQAPKAKRARSKPATPPPAAPA
jgi:hypothetical protein